MFFLQKNKTKTGIFFHRKKKLKRDQINMEVKEGNDDDDDV